MTTTSDEHPKDDELDELAQVLAAIAVLGKRLSPEQRRQAIAEVHAEYAARDQAFADMCREMLHALGLD